ncbi:MAG: leucine--tRNA ligase [Candidatus Gracilibacteria bacterium]|nr:leucine--tRNA ligase [Candidatus Gracilibacteria bacterium]MDD2908706.1 leucine--tRNA ligase [Candidatus Gracilibacteria bacterium]
MKNYDFKILEEKWRKYWEQNGTYKTTEGGNKPKFYILDMFPYPSGEGLHVGHPKGFIATDVIARKKMLEGFNVLHPMGFDAGGLPAENYAIKNKIHPKIAVDKNVIRYKEQLESIGFSYDWDREINTMDPEYYKWTQWIFLQMYNHFYDKTENKAKPIEELKIPEGLSQEEQNKFVNSHRLAYVDFKPINWCPSCKTGLANEDLEDGKCERCGSDIEQKPMRQWVLRITDYAERMLHDLDILPEWEQSIIEMQRNWIGKSTGVQFKMEIEGSEEFMEVYTTRVDTVFGMTFVVIAPEHPLVEKLKGKIENFAEIEVYVDSARRKTSMQRTELNKDKSGIEMKGIFAVNPFNNKKVRVFVADYVLGGYGTGAVMAVPAHDERDFEFAKKKDLEIIVSVEPCETDYKNGFGYGITKAILSTGNSNNDLKNLFEYKYEQLKLGKTYFINDGILVNSGEFTGLTSEEARTKMAEWLELKGLGNNKTQFKIQEWVFSRQRYWGEPIPMIHCKNCGVVPLEEKDLPLLLPQVEAYEPTGTEEGPLANISEWINVKCPTCGGEAKRESNTMPQWAGSSWYWLRYMDPKNDNALVGKESEKYWNEVDIYVGGAEHATRHLIYARFWHKFLFDIGSVSTPEPFKKLQHVGLILAEDGRKMSKRWLNVINPDSIIEEFGADSLRLYESFMGPFAQEVAWSTNGVKGVKKFLDKVVSLSQNLDEKYIDNEKTEILLNKTIKKIGEDIDEFKFNTAVASMMQLVNTWSSQEKINKSNFLKFIQILSPFAPHITEEIWQELGASDSIFKSSWPKYDSNKLIDSSVKIAIQINGKVRDEIEVDFDSDEELVKEKAFEKENIKKYTTGVEIKKIVYVKNKLLSIVI